MVATAYLDTEGLARVQLLKERKRARVDALPRVPPVAAGRPVPAAAHERVVDVRHDLQQLACAQQQVTEGGVGSTSAILTATAHQRPLILCWSDVISTFAAGTAASASMSDPEQHGRDYNSKRRNLAPFGHGTLTGRRIDTDGVGARSEAPGLARRNALLRDVLHSLLLIAALQVVVDEPVYTSTALVGDS